jgi:hypothetical protein
VACRSHDDCPATACHLDPSDPLLGTCFAEDERIWVDNGQVCPGQGTQVSPNCSLSNAVASIDEGDNAVILVAGTGTPYEENAVFDVAATIAVIGTSGPRVTGQTAVFDPTIAVEAGTVYIEGLRVSQNGSHHGMTCSDATLWLQSVDFGTNDQYGFYGVGPCQVRMEATSVHHNRRGGVRMLGGKLVMHNTSIGENGDGAGGPGLLVQFAEVDVVYATIVANEGSGGNDNIGCMMATGSIRNSAIVGTATPSVALDCFTLSYDNNASDSNNSTGPGGFLVTETYNSLWFQNPSVGDFRLGAAPLTPFVDVALWQEGDPPVDADGTPRPMGDVAGYAGVDEPDP